MTLFGVGDLTFGDSFEILPHCTSSFSLEQSFETWGYNYLSSSKKMMVPALDSFNAKTKQWTINLTAPVLTELLRQRFYNGSFGSTVNLDKIFQIIGKPEDIILPPSIDSLTILAYDLESDSEVLASYNSTSGELFFPPGYNNTTKIIFSKLTDGSSLLLGNHIYSFSGILYSHSGTMLLKAPEVQISKYPDYSMQEPIIQLDVLKEIKLYKI